MNVHPYFTEVCDEKYGYVMRYGSPPMAPPECGCLSDLNGARRCSTLRLVEFHSARSGLQGDGRE